MTKTDHRPLAVCGSGMVTGVGLSAAASCAAIRCAIDRFSETRFMDKSGQWIMGSQVLLDKPWQGLAKLVRMVTPAILECLAAARGASAEQIPLILCVAESERPGRQEGLEDELFDEIQQNLGLRFHPLSDMISAGRVAAARALLQARAMIYEQEIPYCIIAGVDSFLSAPTLEAFQEKHRLLTKDNSNGFMPGEAGAAVLVGPPGRGELLCRGIGEGHEQATIESEEPLRGDGLVQAVQAALADAGCDWKAVDYRLTDANGEQYGFKEAALAVNRLLRVRKEYFQIWHPADCIGEVGAAVIPCVLGVALAAMRKGYAPGPGALAHFGSDQGERFALVLDGRGAG